MLFLIAVFVYLFRKPSAHSLQSSLSPARSPGLRLAQQKVRLVNHAELIQLLHRLLRSFPNLASPDVLQYFADVGLDVQTVQRQTQSAQHNKNNRNKSTSAVPLTNDKVEQLSSPNDRHSRSFHSNEKMDSSMRMPPSPLSASGMGLDRVGNLRMYRNQQWASNRFMKADGGPGDQHSSATSLHSSTSAGTNSGGVNYARSMAEMSAHQHDHPHGASQHHHYAAPAAAVAAASSPFLQSSSPAVNLSHDLVD